MSESAKLDQNVALHQMRISQVPLRPSEQGNTSACAQHAQVSNEGAGALEKLSSLDHVRYNIVGK